MKLLNIIFKKYRKLILLILLLTSGFIFRLLLSPLGYHVDIYSNAGWGIWIFNNGAEGFYEHNQWVYSWPTQPPLVSLVYGWAYNLYTFLLDQLVYLGNFIALNRLAPTKFIWLFNFTQWFDDALTSEISFPNGFLISIKLFAIFADIFIGLIVYQFAKYARLKNKFVWPALYLFSPFSFYLSALWGQYDQIGFLFLLLSFLSINKSSVFSSIFYAISISLKPTSLIFVPIYLWHLYKSDFNKKNYLFGVMLSIVFVYLTVKVFSGQTNAIGYFVDDIKAIVFDKSEPRVTTNSFNFWHILIGPKALNHNQIFFIFSYKIWGYFAVLFINLFAITKIKKHNFKSISMSLFIVGYGTWLFMTNMLDRYAFAGILGGLLVSMYYPRLIKYWLILSITYFLNLYRGWWYPDQLAFIKHILEMYNGIFGRLISVVNVATFIAMIKVITSNEQKAQQEKG